MVRISGPQADAALKALAGRLPEPRVATLAELRANDQVLDKALILRFQGPHSATGEDVTELHLHGGRAVVASVQAVLARLPGLRAAESGEFTRRAFENGRIDLAEAEGLADLLAAETESQRRAAVALAGGALSRQIEAWQARLITLSAQLEAALDFSDEADVGELPRGFEDELAALSGEMDQWLARPPAERLRDGIRVVIAGPPNSGKSSLLNALVGRDAAITSEIAGTTRDLVEAPTALGGAPFLLVDTAGLRDSADAIETIGVARARESLAAADLILWLGEPDDCPAPDRAILIQPKADLDPEERRSDIRLSAVTGEGLNQLSRLLIQRSAPLLPRENDVVLSARHRVALGEAAQWLGEARQASDPLIAAEALRQARAALDRVTGRAGVEDMLDALFGRFCIGK